MSIKIKQAIINCLDKITDETFDEDTIRMLLITSREHVGAEGLIKELTHFIVHSERNQGIFHRKVNSRYAKFKLVKDQVNKFDFEESKQRRINTEAELSDFMLGGISVEKVESTQFDTGNEIV